MEPAWHHVGNAEEIPSPALLVYKDRVRENVRRMITMAGGTERLRPHIKTHKMPALVEMQVRMGIQKYKCATIAEAEMAARAGGADVLLAMQPVGPNIGRLIRLIRAFPRTRFSTILDDAGTAVQLSAAASVAGVTVDVLLDVDCGMHRCGIAPGLAAASLFQHIATLAGLNAVGLHAYDGHIHDRDVKEREARCDAAFGPVASLAKGLREAGFPIGTIVAGGTPTFPFHALREGVQCSPGTCVLHDVGYQGNYPDLDFQVAAAVLTRVVSKPGPNLVCVDLGHKSVASENPQPRAEFPELPDARPVTHSEEHLVLETSAAGRLPVGRVLYAFPKHICPTVALYSEAVSVDNQVAEERWPITARNRALTL